MKVKKNQKKRGAALITSFMLLSLLAVAGTAYINSSTEAVRTSKRMTYEAQTTNLCESAIQEVLRQNWRPFKQDQSFEDMDDDLHNASPSQPKSTLSGTATGVGAYSAGIISYEEIPGNSFARNVIIRAVGWIDRDADGVLDSDEPSKTVDVTARFQLTRSQIFDYTYFINNYGWMDGFGQNDLVVNGDMRSNGNFAFLNGSPTINGSVFAALNEKLVPTASGVLNNAPVKMAQATYSSWVPPAPPRYGGESDAAYNTRVATYRADLLARRRQSYSSVSHGADGSSSFEDNRDFVFRSDGAMVNSRPAGAVVGDSTGIKSWSRTSSGSGATTTLIDSLPTSEIVMPDLSDLTQYQEKSQDWVDTKATFMDGTANPNYGEEAYIEVYNSTLGSYERLSSDGNVNGSIVAVGTDTYPIKIHGPVTATQDVVIKGTISGQGTLYAGRNVHIVGSIRYKTKPNFGASTVGNDATNEKADMLGLAARASVMMGNPNTYGFYPLNWMTPVNPPAKTAGTYGRYDEQGVWIPAFDAYQVDSTGRMRYKSVIADATMNSIAEGVNQIDAVLYSNFVGGGNVGTSGGGLLMNGTIISRDEAIVTWSLPIIMNYDNRIRERNSSQKPLIDLELPRSPHLLRSTWQDRGYYQPR